MVVRVRNRGSLKPGPVTRQKDRFTSCADTSGAWTLGSTFKACLLGVVETMTDSVIPGFHRRVQKGDLFFNPMTYTKKQYNFDDQGIGFVMRATANSCSSPLMFQESDVPGAIVCNYLLGSTDTSSVTLDNQGVFSDSEINNLITEVSTSCLAKRGRADDNLFESLAEWRQTLAMLRRPQRILSDFLDTYNRKISRLRRLKGASSAWLAYRYGVRPFVKDVTAIINGIGQDVGRKRVTVRSQKTLNKFSVDTFTTHPSWSWVTTTFRKQTSDSLLVRAMSLDEYVATLASNVGFTAKGLITTPWELVPYSFVADWFVNVGDFFNAIAPAPGYEQLGSCLMVQRQTVNVWTALGGTASPNATIISGNVTGQLSSSVLTKTRSVGLPTPGLVVKADFRLDDPDRVLDGLSLLTQRLDSLFR